MSPIHPFLPRAAALGLCLSIALTAQPPPGAGARFEYWPGASYDPAIPTMKKTLGYQTGDRITWHANLIRYMETLAAAAPSRMKVFDYGKTWEGRRLVYAAIGSEANIRRLPEIRAGMGKLADPRQTAADEAKRLAATLPAVVWLGYGVHGNELSSPEAALLAAYHLLAARNDKLVESVLANVLVLIDPIQNPDGRDRFVHNFEQAEGIEPDENPFAAEHNEPWPMGRTNHYLFDMNRDWFSLTQPETRGRVKALLEWYPVIFVDLHEMGADYSYYFAPEADPFNPHLAPDLLETLEWVGKNNARWFDHFGFSYFTREVFDNFYPGYGASWPCYHGSAAMTYEQASSRGLLMRRSDDTVFHFRETVRQHFVASLATLETAAARRPELIRKFHQFRLSAIEEGRNEPVKEYVLPRRGNVTAVDKLASLLAEQGVEVRRAASEFAVAGKTAPAGSYAISLAQPAKRLVRVLLDPQVPMDAKFVQEQERRRIKKLPDEIYDVTAWSLPLVFNVELLTSPEPLKGTFSAVAPGSAPAGQVTGGKAALAYLVPWGTGGAGRLLAAALREGLGVWSSDKAFTQNGRAFPRGTLLFKVNENPETLGARLAKLAAETGADVVATNSGWVEDGVNFGSRHVVRLRRPVVAMLWDRPTSSYAAGHTRFVLERQFHYPVTAIRTQSLAAADLSRVHVLILPDGAYTEALGAAGAQRLKAWVAAGGTLIGIGGAVSYFADPKIALLAVQQENLARSAPAEPPKKAEGAEPRAPGKLLAKEEEYRKAIEPDAILPDSVAGVLLRARLDPDHWVTAGIDQTVHALVDGRAIFTPVKLDKGVNAAVFAGPDELLASGYLWEENRKQLAYKPLLIVQREGRGHVIGFTADPNFRAFLDGLNVLFLNAVFRGPAHAR